MKRIRPSTPDVDTDDRTMPGEPIDPDSTTPAVDQLAAFENEIITITGTTAGTALSNSTTALQLALTLAGVGPADNVIMPSMTSAITVDGVIHTGATPVFIDSDPDTWNIDPDLLQVELARQSHAGTLPSAVIAVDLFGSCADYSRIAPICEYYEIPLIEDATEALGATHAGQPAGSFGLGGILSFDDDKVIASGGGGMVVSRNPRFITAIEGLAIRPTAEDAADNDSGIGAIPRMSTLSASVARSQLASLGDRVARQRSINAAYRSTLVGLPGIAFMPNGKDDGQTNWLTVITVDPATAGIDRDMLRTRLDAAGIESRPVRMPCHTLRTFSSHRFTGGRVAEEIAIRGLCLPSGPSSTESDIQLVIDEIYSCFEQKRP